MVGRLSPLALGILGVLTGIALTGAVTVGCNARAHADTRPAAKSAVASPATAAGSEGFAASPARAPAGEQLLDTSTPVPAPVQTSRPVARPFSDENLPSWVPVRGRLTVVQSSDLAENLGLVPAGTTKKTEGRISVSELLAQGSAQGGAPPVTTPQAGPRSATWLAANGRVRHGRR